MARRDLVRELTAIKERSGRRGGRFPDIHDFAPIKRAWQEGSVEQRELLASLLPARVVTFLEVFCRSWVQKLIDSGSPYDTRATDLKVDVKFDLELAHSLHGQAISVGLLISHSVPLLNLASISAIFSTLLDHDIFDWLSKVQSRYLIEHQGEAAPPIVIDIDQMKRVLARTFEVRHILVHEFPAKAPFEIAEIGEMIRAAETFIYAADEGLTQLLYGMYPINQREMNRAAHEANEAVREELDRLIDEVANKMESDSIRGVHQLWGQFAEAEARRHAEGFSGGSVYPLYYHTALKIVASDRIRQLRTWLDEEMET